MSIRIITDSTSDISGAQAAEWGLQIAPLKVRFGAEEFIDGVTLTPGEFYQKLAESEELPQTAQVNPDEFSRIFEEARRAGDEVFGIFLSSDLSGTYQSALLARELCGGEGIYLTDSRTVTFGLGLLVREALRMRDRGAGAREIWEEMEQLKGRVRLYAAVDTLKYLRMGGRLSGTAAVLGGLLNIKPLISVQDGKVEAVHKVRGLNPALDWIIGRLEKEQVDTERILLFGHTNAPALCEQFTQRTLERVAIADYDSTSIGSVVGTHAGPGCTGIAFVRKEAHAGF